VLLYRFSAPLLFANAGYLEQDLLRRINEYEVGPDEAIRWVVVSGEPITDVDSTAADAFGELLDLLAERGIRLVFARLKGTVRDRLEPYGLVAKIGREHFYPTTGEAVHAYVQETGVEWHDWSDDRADDRAENSDAPES
jgi:hypothetical protein